MKVSLFFLVAVFKGAVLRPRRHGLGGVAVWFGCGRDGGLANFLILTLFCLCGFFFFASRMSMIWMRSLSLSRRVRLVNRVFRLFALRKSFCKCFFWSSKSFCCFCNANIFSVNSSPFPASSAAATPMTDPLEEEAAPLLEEAAAMWRGTICAREGLLL